MDCRTLSKLQDDCSWFERHHKYLTGESYVYSNENCEIKQGQKTGEDYEINFHSSFLTLIAIFHCCVTSLINLRFCTEK